MRSIKYFHILCDGKTLRELDETRYLVLLNDYRLQLGWIDEDTFFIIKGTVSKEMLFRILKMGGWLIQ